MGLKSFLQQQGFIQPSAEEKTKPASDNNAGKQAAPAVTPVYFPISETSVESSVSAGNDPSFVSPLQTAAPGAKEQIDPAFVKFFEDELGKANLPGPDYFEFRQLLQKTQQKMAAKGAAAPELVLQAVLTSFEAQDVPAAKLVESAKHYKGIINTKKDDFLKGAVAEKNNQLQKRQAVLDGHTNEIKKIQDQLEQLALQKQKLDDLMNKEKTQLEVDKTLGKEGIDKIEKAERLIALAHDYMQAAIDSDIKRLQTV